MPIDSNALCEVSIVSPRFSGTFALGALEGARMPLMLGGRVGTGTLGMRNCPLGDRGDGGGLSGSLALGGGGDAGFDGLGRGGAAGGRTPAPGFGSVGASTVAASIVASSSNGPDDGSDGAPGRAMRRIG